MAKEHQEELKPVKLFFSIYTPEGCDETLAPIIFIPGFFASNRSYSGVRNKISKQTKRKVYAIDMRNHGKSEYSDEFTLDHIVADLDNFMKEHNIPKAVLAGHSIGGKMAAAMALKYPEKVEKLVIEDIPLHGTKAQNDNLIQSFNTLKVLHYKLKELPKELSYQEAQKLLVPLVAKFFPQVVNNFVKAKSELLLPFHKNSDGSFEWAMNMEVLMEVTEHFDRFEMDLSGDPVFNGKTLLMVGEKSVVRVQDNLEEYYKHFPNVEVRIIENGFHTYHVEFPDLYVKLVTKLINE